MQPQDDRWASGRAASTQARGAGEAGGPAHVAKVSGGEGGGAGEGAQARGRHGEHVAHVGGHACDLLDKEGRVACSRQRVWGQARFGPLRSICGGGAERVDVAEKRLGVRLVPVHRHLVREQRLVSLQQLAGPAEGR